MLFTITYEGEDSTELGYLLYKNPHKAQKFELSNGCAYVFYPEVTAERTTAALLLELNPLELAKGKGGTRGLFDYVNDRPYVSSSFMSAAISKVYGTAMSGRTDERQALSDSPLDLTATLTMLPCHGELTTLNRVFEPLGYRVSYDSYEYSYVNLTISGNVRLRDLLRHVYTLIPVFDRQKHYRVGEDEVEKLLRNGEGWLEQHPEREFITSRYLRRRRALVSLALRQLIPEYEPPERLQSLNSRRLDAVADALKRSGARSVLDLGCGEGNLLSQIIRDGQFGRIAGADVSPSALERAKDRLKLERSDGLRERVTLFQASATYRDARFDGYDAIAVVEVLEHLDPGRLEAFERVVLEFAHPRTVVLTTPNADYNAKYGSLSTGEMRHSDHRFELTRAQFSQWANAVAERFGYNAELSEIGESDPVLGSATQMCVLTLK